MYVLKLKEITFTYYVTVNCWLIVNISNSFSAATKNYASAQKFCETAAMNGFKTGRLVEPKTQSFNDKVYAESRVSFRFRKFWMGIKAKGGTWVYTSSGTKIGFENWFKFKKSRTQPGDDCAYSTDGHWIKSHCNNSYLPIICEFV